MKTNYIIDIDGTLLNGADEINNSSKFLKYLDNTDHNYLLATNSIKSHEVQINRFKNIGLTMDSNSIYTPIDSINRYLSKNKIFNVMVVGSDDEILQIKANHTLLSPEIVILLDFEKSNFSYNDLQYIISHVENGCNIITASASTFYLRDGKKKIDTGAFVKLIESIIGNKIPVLGKPSTLYYTNAKSLLCKNDEKITVIGDDWNTDILGAKKQGFESVLIRSGKYKRGDEDLSRPDYVIDNFLDLCL